MGRSDVVLIFGGETAGLPSELHERYGDRFIGMPILSPHVRSLNLSTAVAIALYEVIRQRRSNGAALTRKLEPRGPSTRARVSERICRIPSR